MSGPRVLLVRFSAIGDCVMAAWAATAIRERHPDAFMCWAVEGRCAPVIDRYRLVEQRHEFPRDRWKQHRWSPKTWQEQVQKYLRLRTLGFEYGVDLQGHAKTALCLALAKPKRRIAGGASDALAARLNPVMTGRRPDEHVVEWNHRVISNFGEFKIPKRPIMPDVPSDPEPDLVTISVSAGHPSKVYPATGWQEVGAKLLEHGYRVAFLGGHGDAPIVLAGSEDYVGKLRLKDTLSKVAKSAIHLCGDTGTGHMAAAMGTPVVSVFGAGDPQVYRPYTDRGEVLTAEVTPSQVLEAALRLAQTIRL